MQTINEVLTSQGACSDALEWASTYGTKRAKAWAECPRGDWMLWIIGKQFKSGPWSEDRKPLLACALDCAETVKHLWPKSHAAKIEKAVGTLRLWIAGSASKEKAIAARKQLYADAAADAAAYAAAADAAADAAAYAAAYAAAADAAAYAAAADDADDAARQATLKQCADIVRKHYPKPPKI